MPLKPSILPLAASLGQAGPGPREQGKNGMCSWGVGREEGHFWASFISLAAKHNPVEGGLGMRKGEEKAIHLTFSLGLSQRFYSFPCVSPAELFLLLLPEKQPKRAFVLGYAPRTSKCFSACFSSWLHSWAYFRFHSNCFSACLPTHPSVHLLYSRRR